MGTFLPESGVADGMARDAFQTGVHSLDRALGGGIPPGSVAVALGDANAPPAAPAIIDVAISTAKTTARSRFIGRPPPFAS